MEQHHSTHSPHRAPAPARAAAPSPRPATDDARPRGGAGGGRAADYRARAQARVQAGVRARVRAGGEARGQARAGAQRQGPGAAAPLVTAVRRLPSPRLTGFGAGLLASLAMVTVGCLDALLLSGSPGVYGVLYVLTCAACGVWVRPAELAMAPVGTPIAFLLGLMPINDGGGGLGGQAVGVFTSLSLHAGWLYAGTLVTGLIVLVRRAALVNRRRQRLGREQPRQPSRPPRSPRCSAAQPGRSRP